ncbi:MAG TPA: AMP-binding protein [Bryobacteraceae bacterium]|nr:AMP-binding protein [Bryobacteraceae bacterium]
MRPHLASLVDDFHRHGDQIAIVSRHGLRKDVTSYKTLADLCGRFAALLEERGIVKGDRVLIWGENGAPWIGAFFGCILRGVVPVPIDVAGSEAFAQRVAQEVDPKLVTGSREQLKSFPNGLPFEDFASLPQTTAAAIDGICETNPVQIVFTSGTTGDPKGVVHTHGNILASLRPIEQEMQKYLKYERIFHPLRFLHTLPLSHVFGQFMGIWIPALLAAEVHFESRLIPGDLVKTIHDERISVLVAVPRVLEILQTHLNVNIDTAKGFPAWRRRWHFRRIHRMFGFKFWALICGGATLPENLERFWNVLGFVVIQGYGMTETAALVSLNHPFHASQGSIGKVLPGREIRLGPDGEILVRGDTVSKSTWQGGRMQTQESEWLATGDLASQDASGNLKFKGRKKEVIVTAAGLNIYPDDLEAALLRQPLIKTAAVVESDGEPVAALILQQPGDAAAAVRDANAELAGYQQIRRWMIWPDPDFPRTSSGKILRREVAAGTAPRILTDILTQIKGKVPDSEDLQLDSLGRVELQAAIASQLGVEIDDASYSQVNTLGELRGLLSGSARPEARDENIYPIWPWSRLQSAVRVLFIETVMRAFVAVLGNPHVVRAEAPKKPMLIVSNHVTVYDVPLILYALPGKMRRRVAVAMAGEMMLNLRKARNLGNWFLNLCGPPAYFLITALFNVFPLPQLGNFRKSFQQAGRAMDRGFHVLVFPEGKRTPDGLMHAFQKGAGMLWKELQCDALPVYLGGMSTGKWFRSGTLSIRIGQPIPFNPDLEPAEATRVLEEAVRQLSPDLRPGL